MILLRKIYLNIAVFFIIGLLAKPSIASEEDKSIIQGKITDQSGKPLIGADVLIQSEGSGTSSDENGFYYIVLPNSDPGKEVVVDVQYMGYISKSPIGLIGSLFGGIGSLNNRLQNSDFGRSATLAEFFQRRRDRKAREEAAARGAAKEIQRNISQGTSGDIGGGWSQRDTGGGTVSFSGPSGESFSGYSNTQEGIGAASADWGSF